MGKVATSVTMHLNDLSLVDERPINSGRRCARQHRQFKLACPTLIRQDNGSDHLAGRTGGL